MPELSAQLFFGSSNFLRIRRTHDLGSLASRHSQIRMTDHPALCSCRVVLTSRRRLPWTFSFHAWALVFGVRFLLQSCPCQKQPSTKTTSRASCHTKSGRPARGWWRCQPSNLALLSNDARRSSVVRFPLPRTLDISCPRERFPKVVLSLSELPGHLLIANCFSAFSVVEATYNAASSFSPTVCA